MNKYKLSRLASAIVLAVGLSTPVFAEDTSSAIRGSILGIDGEAVTDATITVIHEPTGSKRTLKVNSAGTFSATGLRVGGPYTVLIDSDAYKDSKLNNIYINLGEVFSISESLESTRGEVITITARSLDGTNYAAGTSSTFSAADIAGTPAFNRDLKDIVKQNPLAVVLSGTNTELSIAGDNPKYNSLTIDGVRLDDDFGLQGNGYPTERSPISLDAVEQLTIVTSPFSTKYGGFSGGQISVVTKSGTNDFHGSIFYEKSKDDWAGTPHSPDDGDEVPLSFDEETIGLSFSGPIIKDKLFFFASYETYEAPSEVFRGPIDSNAPNLTRGVRQDDVNEVTRIARDVYGIDAGDWDVSLPLEDEKYLVKLDWNINDDHRAAFTYAHAASNSVGNIFGFSSGLYLSSHWYDRSNEFDTYTAQLYSHWSDAFSTEIKIALKESLNGQVPLAGKTFGEIFVETYDDITDPSSPRTGEIRLGPDDSRHANILNNDTLQFRFAGEYLYGDHAIAFGYEHDEVDVFNLFVQHNLGTWDFRNQFDGAGNIVSTGVEQFEAQLAGFFEYQNNVSLDVNDAAAEFTIKNDTLYVEDNWDVSPELNITYGLRYERLSVPQKPNFNQNFFDRYGFSNTTSLDGLDIILPRFGFNYSFNDEVEIYGGFGRYSGGQPNVWIANSYTNDGTRIVLYRDFDGFAAADPNTIPQEALDFVSGSPLGDGNVDVIDPNFELPSSWKTSLGFDYRGALGPLGEGWLVSSEIIYKDIDQAVVWSDLSREIDTTKGINGFTIDGRPIYRRTELGRRSTDVMVTNASGGTSLIETFTLANKWDNGIKMNLSYTHQDVEDKVAGTRSTSGSNYTTTTAYDRENVGVGRSSYEVKHRLFLNLSYTTQFFEGYNSEIHMNFERRSGRPFSWTLDSNRNDEGLDGNSSLGSDSLLPYIPTGPNDPAVAYASGYSYEQLVAELTSVGVSTAGGPLERNSANGPWTTTMDLLFRQEIPGLMEGHKGLFYFDIKNALAIFDENLAQVQTLRFGENVEELLDYSINAAGQYVYSSNGIETGDAPLTFRPRESTWSLKLGVKYTF